MRKFAVVGIVVMLGAGVALGLAGRGVMHGGLGAIDDIDWYGI